MAMAPGKMLTIARELSFSRNDNVVVKFAYFLTDFIRNETELQRKKARIDEWKDTMQREIYIRNCGYLRWMRVCFFFAQLEQKYKEWQF